MNIAYKTFEQAPSSQRIAGIPLGYPWQQQTLQESDSERQALLEEAGWTIASQDAFNALKASLDAQVTSAQLTTPTLDSDKRRYILRARVKDEIVAEIAAENMTRIRSGVWTVPQLVQLMADSEPALKDLASLSFELAIQKVMAISNPLATPEIKQGIIDKITANLF